MSEKIDDMHLTIYTDGACWGNPGPAAIGAIIKDQQGTLIRISEYIGLGTNNRAEYSAVIKALSEAIKLNPDEVTLYLDSELVVRQLTGRYRVKSKSILPLYVEVSELLEKFAKVSVVHVPRECNAEADALATAALHSKA
jgi:ribonuclease HI